MYWTFSINKPGLKNDTEVVNTHVLVSEKNRCLTVNETTFIHDLLEDSTRVSYLEDPMLPKKSSTP